MPNKHTKDPKRDKCPKCGSEPKLGIRKHPPYSIEFGMIKELEQTSIYFHDPLTMSVLYKQLKQNTNIVILGCKHWNGKKWEEYNMVFHD